MKPRKPLKPFAVKDTPVPLERVPAHCNRIDLTLSNSSRGGGSHHPSRDRMGGGERIIIVLRAGDGAGSIGFNPLEIRRKTISLAAGNVCSANCEHEHEINTIARHPPGDPLSQTAPKQVAVLWSVS